MENNNQQKKIEGAFNPTTRRNLSLFYSKKYYLIFFTIMIVSFILIFWLCNYNKLKELFQTITFCALSIAIAEYATRNFINKQK